MYTQRHKPGGRLSVPLSGWWRSWTKLANPRPGSSQNVESLEWRRPHKNQQTEEGKVLHTHTYTEMKKRGHTCFQFPTKLKFCAEQWASLWGRDRDKKNENESQDVCNICMRVSVNMFRSGSLRKKVFINTWGGLLLSAVLWAPSSRRNSRNPANNGDRTDFMGTQWHHRHIVSSYNLSGISSRRTRFFLWVEGGEFRCKTNQQLHDSLDSICERHQVTWSFTPSVTGT